MELKSAPEWKTKTWLNTTTPMTLELLRGKVILLHAFQMLCPGCVSTSIPQVKRVAEHFKDASLQVIGMHTVFEHHSAMDEISLRAFLHEYGVRYPVGIDMPGLKGNPMPQTMQAYEMRGTPTTVLIDAEGCTRRMTFGTCSDLALGADIAILLSKISNRIVVNAELNVGDKNADCRSGQCVIS